MDPLKPPPPKKKDKKKKEERVPSFATFWDIWIERNVRALNGGETPMQFIIKFKTFSFPSLLRCNLNVAG